MVKYYCNICDVQLSKDERTTVQPMLPDGTKPSAYHFCPVCCKELKNFIKIMSDRTTKVTADKDTAKQKSTAATSTPKVEVEPKRVEPEKPEVKEPVQTAAPEPEKPEVKEPEKPAVTASTFLNQSQQETKKPVEAPTTHDTSNDSSAMLEDGQYTKKRGKKAAAVKLLQSQIDFEIKVDHAITKECRDFILNKVKEGHKKTDISDALELSYTSINNIVARYLGDAYAD